MKLPALLGATLVGSASRHTRWEDLNYLGATLVGSASRHTRWEDLNYLGAALVGSNKKFCCRAGHFDDAMVEDAAMLRVRNASAVNSQVSRGIQV